MPRPLPVQRHHLRRTGAALVAGMSLRGSELFELSDLPSPSAARGYNQPWQVSAPLQRPAPSPLPCQKSP